MQPDCHVVLLDPDPRGLRPSDSPTRSLASRFDGSLRSRGSLRCARSRPISPRLAFNFRLQPDSDPMQPDCHVVLLDLEHLRQLFDRQPLHVTEQE